MKSIHTYSGHDRILIEPGVPPLIQSSTLGCGWETLLHLPALYTLTQGLASHPSQYKMIAELHEPGEVYVHIDTEDKWPSGMQILNLHWLLHEDAALVSVLLNGIHAFYPQIRTMYDFLPEKDLPDLLPDIAIPDELLPLIRMESIIIHTIDASIPYLGIDFSCAWDEEHGLGVLTYGTEILEIGTGDVSCSPWKAQEHRDKILASIKMQQIEDASHFLSVSVISLIPDYAYYSRLQAEAKLFALSMFICH